MAVAEAKVELSAGQLAKVKKFFACIDANEDGKIDITEVHAHLTGTYESAEASTAGIEGFMKRYDENKDNRITEEEMTHYFQHVLERLTKANKAAMVDEILDKMLKEHTGKVTEEERKLVDQYFEHFDRDEDGAIRLDEMENTLNDENLRLKKFLERFDANKDRKVTHEEVMLYCCNVKARIANNPKISLTEILTKMIEAQKPKLDTLELFKVKQLFLCYDANEDGQIDMGEMQTQLKSSAGSEASGNEAVMGFVNRYDENGDGIVTLDEVQNYVLGIKTRLAKKDKEEMVKSILDRMIAEQVGKLSEDERALADEYFALFDANEDGLVTLDEAADQLNDENLKLAAYLKRFDANHDGKVSKTELLLYCCHTKTRVANNAHVDLTKILTNMIASQKKETAEN